MDHNWLTCLKGSDRIWYYDMWVYVGGKCEEFLGCGNVCCGGNSPNRDESASTIFRVD